MLEEERKIIIKRTAISQRKKGAVSVSIHLLVSAGEMVDVSEPHTNTNMAN